jgi:transcriptional repressor NrdR
MNFKESKAIYLQIADRICDEILLGQFAEEERIPSVREYATIVEVNANTVMRSFDYLQSQNIIYNKFIPWGIFSFNFLEVTTLKCPYCGNENTKVIDSRPTEEGAIRRRRQCESCAKRFTTYEKIEMMPIIVIKKDDNREPYDREKIVAGIVRSCHKRPVSLAQINQMVDEIETQIFNSGEKEIPTTKIGMIVMDKLKKLDEVAYVRFASVYREFKDVNTFLEEINKILK